MKKINKKLIVVLAIAFILGLAGLVVAATSVNLGTADDFVILAGSTITNTGSSVITGDLGLSPGTSVTGFPPGTLNGNQYVADVTAAQAKTDLTVAYNDAVGQTPVSTVPSELGGTTKAAGIYNSADGEFSITGTLTLDGGGDPNAIFIFKTTSTLTAADSSNVVLENGAQAYNVFWQVGSSATLGTGAAFKGNILASVSITLNTGAEVEGRLLADSGAVTLDTNIVTKPTLVHTQLTVTKTVINTDGGTKVISDFPLFIDGSSVTSGVASTTTIGLHTVSETSSSGYTATIGGDCATDGTVTLAAGEIKTCTITNRQVVLPASGGGGSYYDPVPPLIDLVKVPNPLALPEGSGTVEYTYTLENIGTVPVNDITIVGDTCSPITLISGDVHDDARLDVGETWVYTCSATLTETHTNIVTAIGWANGISATDIANATVVVGVPVVPPLIHVTKVPNPLVLSLGGGMVTYTNKVTNPGTVALSNVNLTDDMCGPVEYISGDTNSDSKLDVAETWVYTCQAELTDTTVNTVTASGEANGLTAKDFAIVTVVVAPTVVPKLPDTGVPSDWDIVSWDSVVLAGALIIGLTLLLAAIKKYTN
jgi:uncharacterized repeat protein (TIGR01451 family)